MKFLTIIFAFCLLPFALPAYYIPPGSGGVEVDPVWTASALAANNGSGLTNISGTQLTTGTVNSNALDAATWQAATNAPAAGYSGVIPAANIASNTVPAVGSLLMSNDGTNQNWSTNIGWNGTSFILRWPTLGITNTVTASVSNVTMTMTSANTNVVTEARTNGSFYIGTSQNPGRLRIDAATGAITFSDSANGNISGGQSISAPYITGSTELRSGSGLVRFANAQPPSSLSIQGCYLGSDGTNCWVVIRNSAGVISTNKITLSTWP